MFTRPLTKTTSLNLTLGVALSLPMLVFAQSLPQEQARVISVTPVTKQITTSQQVCAPNQPSTLDSKATPQNSANCRIESTPQSITTYQVTYEYAGRQLTTEMANRPGKLLNIQVNIAVLGSPPDPIIAPPPGVVVPAGVSYEPPAYASPGADWKWVYDQRYGWGWSHPRYGWHRDWK